MSEANYSVDLDRYSSTDLEACDEVEIVNVENRKGKMRKRRGRSTSASSEDDVIVLGSSQAAIHSKKGPTVISTDSEEEGSRAVPVGVAVKRLKGRRLQPCSSGQVQAHKEDVLFVKESKAQTEKTGASSGPPLPLKRAVQDGIWLWVPGDKGQQSHQNEMDATHSHDGVARRHNEVKKRSVSPDLPECTFLPPATTLQTSSVDEGISSLDVLHSFPEVGVSNREERFWSKGTPLYWTECTNCTVECMGEDCTPAYHSMKVEAEVEWDRVTRPMSENRFNVDRVFRIQNIRLWKRYRSEMEFMLDGAHEGYQLNQAWLYHVSTAGWRTVCEEGLDPRLAREGCFGRGTYFSDNPVKCHNYSRPGTNRHTIILCRVLLGDIKEYPDRMTDQGLKREPTKSNPRPGEKKTYDSVKGNLSGQDEYVIYNPYRSLPEYVIEYTSYEPLGGPPRRPTAAGGGSYHMLAAALQATRNALSTVPGVWNGPYPPPYRPPPAPGGPMPFPNYSQPPQPALPWAAMTHHQRNQQAARAKAARNKAWTKQH